LQAGGPGLSRNAFILGALWELGIAMYRLNASLGRSGLQALMRAPSRAPLSGLASPSAEVVCFTVASAALFGHVWCGSSLSVSGLGSDFQCPCCISSSLSSSVTHSLLCVRTRAGNLYVSALKLGVHFTTPKMLNAKHCQDTHPSTWVKSPLEVDPEYVPIRQLEPHLTCHPNSLPALRIPPIHFTLDTRYYTVK
jgi:hypothetical protein